MSKVVKGKRKGQSRFYKWLISHKEKGMNKSNLASKLGIPRQQLTNYYNGSIPNIQTLKDIILRAGYEREQYYEIFKDLMDEIIFQSTPFLDDDHICRIIEDEILTQGIDAPLEDILAYAGVTEEEWESWASDPEIEIGQRRALHILGCVRDFKGKLILLKPRKTKK